MSDIEVVITSWHVRIAKERFPDLSAAQAAVVAAAPGVSGVVTGNEAGGTYELLVPSTAESQAELKNALADAGIPATVRMLRPAEAP